MNDIPLFSILLVDDDMSDLDTLNSIFKTEYIIYFAKSGHEALKRASHNTPDLIILDVLMPDMSGFEVISELRKSISTRSIPVIFITGLNAVKDEERGFQLGAIDYITKPFHSSIVKVRVKSHMETIKRINANDNVSIMLKTRQEIRSLPFRELVYIDVSGHWLSFHMADGTSVNVYASLKNYENIILADPRFAHCHKSFIVNMDFVDVVEVRDILLRSGIRLPISKRYVDFKKQYVEWFNG